jgi:citrate lyase beta subunit
MNTMVQNAIDAISLGATLYVPATRDDLVDVVLGRRIADLRSVVVCLEDSILEEHLPTALRNLARLLSRLQMHGAETEVRRRPVLLVRPRTPEVLAAIMAMNGTSAIDGLVLPKATADNMPDWMNPIANRPQLILPTVETREAFDTDEMRRLRAQLLTMKERVLCIRIGGNDLLQLVGARRSRTRTAYDGPLGSIVTSLISAFSPWGFKLSAPVLEDFVNHDLLREEVERDIEHGLLTKTAIHPSQIPVIQALYAVTRDEDADARHILDEHAAAVYAEHGAMSEPATHRRWAESIVSRRDHHGLREPSPSENRIFAS